MIRKQLNNRARAWCRTAALRAIKPTPAVASIFALVMIAAMGYLGTTFGYPLLSVVQREGWRALHPTGRSEWPPRRGQPFPDVALVDSDGQPRKLTEFRGRVVLLHIVGTSCRTSVALAGGKRCGAFDGIEPHAGLCSLADYARQLGNFGPDDPRVVIVHLILFDDRLAAPSATHLREWERHFGVNHETNQLVLGGTPALVTAASRELVPGCLLLDQQCLVRAAATGREPADDLFSDLLPMIPRLHSEASRSAAIPNVPRKTP